MPKNTRVHRCVEKLKNKSGVNNPYAVCQASTGQSFATGKSTRKSDHKKIGSPKSESKMQLPSIQVMSIAAKGDQSLFESLMARAGFRIVQKDNDPLNTNVQEEAVAAVASAITEDVHRSVRMSPYHKQIKTLAEQAGYVVMIENCGPPGADPCAGDEVDFADGMAPVEEVGEAMIISDIPPTMDDGESSEVQQVADLPIGTELAAEILAVLKGKGIDDMGEGDEGLHGEMPIGNFGDEEELPPAEDNEDEELPPQDEEESNEEDHPFKE